MTLDDLKAKVRKERVDGKILFTPQSNNEDEAFEAITMPHWSQFVSPNDIDQLYYTITSRKLAGNFDRRKRAIDDIMASRGFKFIAGGTNRAAYRHMEFPSIVAKVPIDRVGLNDNFCEFRNQKKLWPYCAKMIQVTPLGVIGFAERLEPILNRNQFNAFAPMIYYTIIQIIGKYIMEDIGTDYYKNWGIRKGFGACILDYPYIFDLDVSKLICKQPLGNSLFCFGEIDYDPGYNHLYCKKCGRVYNASELQMQIKDEAIITCDNTTIGGKKPMLVTLKKGNNVLSSSLNSDSIVRPDFRSSVPNRHENTDLKVSLKKGEVVLAANELDNAALPVVEKHDDGEVATTAVSIEETPVVNDPIPETPVTVQAVADEVKQEIEKADRVDSTIAEELINEYKIEDVISSQIQNKVSDPIPEPQPELQPEVKVENVSAKKDEFPPNPWAKMAVQPKRRRIITDSETSNIIQKRPDNPYNR